MLHDDMNATRLALALKIALEDERSDKLLYFCWLIVGAEPHMGWQQEKFGGISKTDRLMMYGRKLVRTM